MISLIASAAETVSNGSMLLAIPISVLAGFLSFASPCVLPLVPGYLSYVTGLSHQELMASDSSVKQRSRIIIGTFGFVLGFTLLFVSYGAAFGELGKWLLAYQQQINIVLGVLVVLLGASFLGWLPFFEQDFRPRARLKDGVWTAPILGLLFGLGWAPCIGPTLAAVQTLAFTEGSALRGAALSAFYCLGLGLPFLLIGLGYRKSLVATTFLRRHSRGITRVGGGMMVLIGLALITGLWNEVTRWLQTFASSGWIVF